MSAQEFLDDTKLDDRTREEKRKVEVKKRADEEYARARGAVKQKRLRQKLMQQRLANIDAKGQRGGFRSKSHKSVTSGSSVSSYDTSEFSETTASSQHSKKGRINRPASMGSSRPSTADSGILFIDKNKQAGIPSRPKTADSLKIDVDKIAKWEGARVKTPIWGNFGKRSGSAGHTPWNRIGSAGAKHFGGWLGNLRDLISRGGSRADSRASTADSEKEPEKPETSTPSPTSTTKSPTFDPNAALPSKSLRPVNRRRKDRHQANKDAPFEEALSNDGSMMFGEENSLGSVESGVTERSFEFFSNDGNGSSSPSNKKKKKKKKKKVRSSEVTSPLPTPSPFLTPATQPPLRPDLLVTEGDKRGFGD